MMLHVCVCVFPPKLEVNLNKKKKSHQSPNPETKNSSPPLKKGHLLQKRKKIIFQTLIFKGEHFAVSCWDGLTLTSSCNYQVDIGPWRVELDTSTPVRPQLSQYACSVLQSQPRKVASLKTTSERSFAHAHAVARPRGSCGEYFMAGICRDSVILRHHFPEDLFQLCCWQFLSKAFIRMCSYSRPASSPSKEGRTSSNSQNWGPDCHLEYR